MAEISIIVPVYKVEQYLDRCVNSIMGQSFVDFDLILVDDGSPDHCGKMCDVYEAEDMRIHVIHQKNGGLSAARNTGIDWAIEHSDSKWLTFVDSDDWIHPRYLEVLLNAAKNYSTAISIGGAFWTKGEPLPNEISNNPELWKTADYYVEHITNATVAWGKLYKKDCFDKIRYPEGKIHEDEYVTYQILFRFEFVSVVNQPLYGYFQNDQGITRRQWSPSRLDAIEGLEEQISFFLNNGFEEIAKRRFRALLKVVMSSMDQVSQSTDMKFIERYKYNRFLRKKMRKNLFLYNKYKWVTIRNNRPEYASASVCLSFCRRIWLGWIKPMIHLTD